MMTTLHGMMMSKTKVEMALNQSSLLILPSRSAPQLIIIYHYNDGDDDADQDLDLNYRDKTYLDFHHLINHPWPAELSSKADRD